MSSERYQSVEFKTIDGITLRGWWYTVPGPSPAIVMTHGWNCVKNMLLPDVAERFQYLGYNVLLYDARTVGASDGEPRNQPSPYQMAEDISDAVSYVSSLPSVSTDQIILWGMSYGASVSACAAAVDRRPKALVMICPVFSYVRGDRRERAFAQLMRDRSSQLQGNPPMSLQPFNARGDNLIGMAGAGGPGGLEAAQLMQTAEERGYPAFRSRITLQAYHKLALFRPKEIMAGIEGVPVLMVIPECDDISSPDEQQAAFDLIKGTPKRVYVAGGMGHLSILTAKGSEVVMQVTLDFVKAALEGKIT
ncbi:alpha/beta-hydrolase [Aspergillus steynii IBT 23096]|uniref:Alpha/beta-hydrolase n=1 Tax=Aspergillus steynii IBT 23096 TaxID=1392250 RepID=A0A2I2G4I4_9EURO|nr:alpha/beta-hydrolase [Aspergillus steynii IBT 23096]PLB47778.1 alpha/beta-hydrolase [Aspergillus steynii IBT 23096]